MSGSRSRHGVGTQIDIERASRNRAGSALATNPAASVSASTASAMSSTWKPDITQPDDRQVEAGLDDRGVTAHRGTPTTPGPGAPRARSRRPSPCRRTLLVLLWSIAALPTSDVNEIDTLRGRLSRNRPILREILTESGHWPTTSIPSQSSRVPSSRSITSTTWSPASKSRSSGSAPLLKPTTSVP